MLCNKWAKIEIERGRLRGYYFCIKRVNQIMLLLIMKSKALFKFYCNLIVILFCPLFVLPRYIIIGTFAFRAYNRISFFFPRHPSMAASLAPIALELKFDFCHAFLKNPTFINFTLLSYICLIITFKPKDLNTLLSCISHT